MAASALADAAGVSRQTIYAIEAGDFAPNTAVALRLARALDATVEDLFALVDDAPPRERAERVELLPGEGKLAPGQPVQLCRVGRRTVAAAPSPVNWAFPASDGVFAGHSTARVFDPDADFGRRVLVAGCDPAMSVLARRLARGGFDMVAAHRNSTDSLDLLARGLAHVAGAHLGESNVPEVLRRFPKRSVAVFSFAVWEQGIVTARGNPKHVAGVADLARRDVAIVNRESGAGSRRLLDARLAELGIASARVRGYDREAHGHLPAAWQVHAGAADCCIATRAAARLFGLGFVPLATERYDFVVRKSDIGLPAVSALLEELGRAAFRREVENFGGYDTRAGGDRVL
jgi:molybdate-binding protein/DNA-binding XRE family transcriptional regulator